ncbi:hypothetical protein PoB_000633900 [Plakobranchus ocellatus]|uniref:Uncharacterized protein n=1 Tax=Plakobranchus ocellatus TaxID=259542 RepID=A0AAV3YC49_9GAST|nr:hypothetical protein PoB_000633900 [Plakobranchus ocellatus]
MDSESALRSARTLLSQVRAPPPAAWPDGGHESLSSTCCGLTIYKTKHQPFNFVILLWREVQHDLRIMGPRLLKVSAVGTERSLQNSEWFQEPPVDQEDAHNNGYDFIDQNHFG